MHSITLYINNSENYRVDKSLTAVLNTSVALKGGSGIENVEIDIQTSTDISRCNYMYIPDFGRYYFITSIAAIRNDVYRLTAHVDVLSTYKEELRQLYAIIDKQENSYTNVYINDNSRVMQSNEFNRVINFPNGFNDSGEFILICAGG